MVSLNWEEPNGGDNKIICLELEKEQYHRQGLKQDPQTLQLELRLEAAGDVREGIKRGYKIWAEGFAQKWEQCLEVSQKGKGTSLRLKFVEDNIYKTFP